MPLHLTTPILHSATINQRLNKRLSLKMECHQPVGSFKMRGIGALCEQRKADGAERLISSSGGNAGYAAAHVAKLLDIPITVVVPDTTSDTARARIAAEGADVVVHGSVWDDADAHARELVEETNGGYIHPFDHPAIWNGHATLIDEAAEQIDKPNAVVVAVGGGGLMCGVLEGMHRNSWDDVPLLAVETAGANSLAASMKAQTLTALDDITSIAKTLGAKKVARKAYEWTQHHPVRPVTVSDADAVDACLRFADDMRTITEPACGAALSLMYAQAEHLTPYEHVLMVVCGGAGVTVQNLLDWKQDFAS